MEKKLAGSNKVLFSEMRSFEFMLEEPNKAVIAFLAFSIETIFEPTLRKEVNLPEKILNTLKYRPSKNSNWNHLGLNQRKNL